MNSDRPLALRSERVALGEHLRPATVLIEEGHILAVVPPGESLPPDLTMMDLGSDLLVPGLIDCHTHLFLDALDGPMAYERQLLTSLPLRTLRGARAGRTMLDFGFTTVRDVCTEGAGYADVALGQAVREGAVEGPRIVPSGPGIGITGGYMPNLAQTGCLPYGCAICDGVEAARREVRAQVAAGVAWIKVFADWPCRGAPGHAPSVCPTFTGAELSAICDEARRRGGRRVAAHVTSDAGARQAIECGAASLEHLGPLTRQTLDLAAERGVFLVPTLSVVHHGQGEHRQKQIDEAGEALQRAMAAGVRVACGSDIGCFPHSDGSLQELAHLVSLGMPTHTALAAATSEAAALLGMPELGVIAAGAVADLAVFRAPEAFELGEALKHKPIAVFQGGRQVRGETSSQ